MNSFMNSAKRLVAKVFAKKEKSPEEVAEAQERKAFHAEQRESERALKRRRRSARMESYNEH
ncbi:hypothetical protein NW766_003410 [Fusarium irregulare]|uniref:Uncharacterized protein n=1 Tax=Fusarium irregulare TaxID=2494466 RepID=A0A9W8PXN6_9HYPO|nr:hypothetical protein NW766_003410 [Fusarium irregulare]